MKANEAPEKIYLEWYRIGDKKYRDWVITPKTNNEPIEYTRTDAFIEKACEAYCEAYCKVCDTQECFVMGECPWRQKFRKQLLKQIK